MKFTIPGACVFARVVSSVASTVVCLLVVIPLLATTLVGDSAPSFFLSSVVPVAAMTDLNTNLPGSFVSQFEQLIQLSSKSNGVTCETCLFGLHIARGAAKISKKSLVPVLNKLCAALTKSTSPLAGAGAKICEQVPWNRQITSRIDKRTMMDKMMKRSMFDWAEDRWDAITEDDDGQDEGEDGDDSSSIHSSFLNDIYNVLMLMDLDSDDGRYFCYMFGFKTCPLPSSVTEPDLSSWWPPRPENATPPKPGGKTVNVLHLSDVHLQRGYTVGAEGNCGNIMCCASSSVYVPAGPKSGDSGHTVSPFPAPPMGYYKCDTPELLLDSIMNDVAGRGRKLAQSPAFEDASMLEYTDKTGRRLQSRRLSPRAEDGLGFEFAIFTGDMIDHNPLLISYQDSVWEEEQSLRKFKQYLGGIPVYPVLGNHDTYPYGQVAQERSGYANLFTWNSDLMADLWGEFGWLNDGVSNEETGESALDMVRKHYGGFAVTTRRGLRVISLNSNFWYMWNLYNYWNTSDPDTSGMLRFLSDELVECERRGQYAWVIAHVPPGGIDTDAMPVTAGAFGKIVQRFSPHVITGVFFGHTHRDEFQLVYAGDITKHVDDTGNGDGPVNVAWIAQSITPLVNYNPGWRYYKVDSETFQVMDSVNFYTRLNDTFDAASDEYGSRTTDWHHLYSTRDQYDPEGRWPADRPLDAAFWQGIATRIRDDKPSSADNGDDNLDEGGRGWSDKGFAQEYTNFGYRLSPHTPQCHDDQCRKKAYCYVTSFNALQVGACKKRYGLA